MPIRITAAAFFLILTIACTKQSQFKESVQQLCSISGRVLDEKQTGIRTMVNLLRGRVAGGVRHYDGVATTESNTIGEYQFKNVTPGEYFLRAIGSRTFPPSSDPDCRSCCDPSTDLVTAFYPGAGNTGDAKGLLVNEGQAATGVDIHLPRVPVFCVRGEVRGTTGTRLGQISVLVERWDEGFDSWTWGASVINKEGRFLLNFLPAGAYKVKVTDGTRYGRTFAEQSLLITNQNISRFIVRVPLSPKSGLTPKKKMQ